jgi:hypothetical protein
MPERVAGKGAGAGDGKVGGGDVAPARDDAIASREEVAPLGRSAVAPEAVPAGELAGAWVTAPASQHVCTLGAAPAQGRALERPPYADTRVGAARLRKPTKVSRVTRWTWALAQTGPH